MHEYVAIYSDVEKIRRRLTQFTAAFTDVIYDYQKQIDDDMDYALRAILGEFDQNGFRIILPLTGDFNQIDPQKREITLRMSPAIQKFADDAVIANFRFDFSENPERKQMNIEDLKDELNVHFGSAISSPRHDFTGEFLLADKVLWDDNTAIQLEDDSGVLLWDGPNPRKGDILMNGVII